MYMDMGTGKSLFQFTPLREGRRSAGGLPAAPAVYFNSRPSARGDHRLPRDEGGMPHFNSRPSARGDVRRRASYCSGGVFQFTPLREGRLRRGDVAVPMNIISIHAPPRGATIR